MHFWNASTWTAGVARQHKASDRPVICWEHWLLQNGAVVIYQSSSWLGEFRSVEAGFLGNVGLQSFRKLYPSTKPIHHPYFGCKKKHDRLKEWRVLTVFAGVYERDIFLHLSSIHCATLCNEFAEKKLVAKRRFDCPPSSSTPQNCITMAVIGIQKSQN